MLLEGILGVVTPIINKLIPDKGEAARMAQEVTMALVQQQAELTRAAGAVVKAEAESTHFLTASWRPITMLVFVFIVANNYIIAPYVMLFFSVDVALETPAELWDLIKIGLGGYVMGRSVEKAVATWRAPSASVSRP